jgi:hypothetical protein
MAMGRSKQDPNETLSPASLEELRTELARLGYWDLIHRFKACLTVCSRPEMRVPSPAAIQTLVQIWKTLRKMRRAG